MTEIRIQSLVIQLDTSIPNYIWRVQFEGFLIDSELLQHAAASMIFLTN